VETTPAARAISLGEIGTLCRYSREHARMGFLQDWYIVACAFLQFSKENNLLIISHWIERPSSSHISRRFQSAGNIGEKPLIYPLHEAGNQVV
jgi:hypothetical protein